VNKGLMADADAGKLTTGADVDRAAKAYAEPVQDLDHVRPVAMSAPPARPEVEWTLPTVETLASLPGIATPSDELGRLFQSLPGLPCFTTEGRLISLTDEEAGIGYSATWKPPAAVQSVKLFARGAFGCAQYRGVLPDGLLFSDRRGDVEKKLGRPDMSFTEWNLYTAIYPALGLEITYQNPSGRDPNNVIHHITVTKPDLTAQRPNVSRGSSSPRLTLRLVVDPVRGSGLGGAVAWGVAALACVALIVLVCVRVGWRWPVAVTASVLCLGGLLLAAYLRSAPDVEDLPLGHTGLYYEVLRDAVVDERSIERVTVAIPSAGPRRASIEIHFTSDGAKALRRVSAAHIGRKLAIVLDGRIISVPVIDDTISNFVGGSAADPSTTVDEAWNLAGRLNAAVDAI